MTFASLAPTRVLARVTPVQAVIAIIVVGTMFRLTAAASIGMGNDEGYHISCARHLDLCYFEHPPMFAWLARIGLQFGDSALVVRLPFILLFAATTWLCFGLTRRLFGEWPGFLAALLLNLAPVFSLTTAVCVLPDGPLMFSWLACSACLVRLLFDPTLKRPTLTWLAAGLFLGLACLSKYHAIFLAAGTVLYVITSRGQRRWLVHPGPYLGVLLAALVFSPVLIWNANHEWISFIWQSKRGTTSAGLHPEWVARSIGGQALWLTPLIWGPLIWELGVCLRGGPRDSRRWFIACLSALPILFFTGIAISAPYGMLFHWQAPGYLLLFVPLGASLARRMSPGFMPRWSRGWLAVTAALGLVEMVGVTTHAANGWGLRVLPTELAARVGPIDPTLEALDLRPVAEYLERRGLLEGNDRFVFCNRWFLAGRIDFALRSRVPVYCLNPNDPRGFAFFAHQQECLGKDGIFISTTQFSPEPAKEFETHFAAVEPLGRVDVTRGGAIAQTYYVHRYRLLHTTVAQPYGLTVRTVSAAGERGIARR